MSSPVTLSGFNGIDFTQLLNAVMVQERAPITAIESRKSAIETQNTQFGTLAGKLSTLASAADTLADPDEFESVTVTSSDTTAVGVTTSTGTVEGTYDVVVTELARAQATASTSTYASTSEVVASAGTLTLTASGGSPISVTLTGDTTLQELAAAINDADDTPVKASIVQSSPGSYRLVLTGTDTGEEAAFTLQSTLSGGSGLTFGDQDNDGVSGDSAADNTVQATDASLTVNNLTITSSTNTVTDAIPGVTLSLLKKDPVTTVRIGATRDSADATTKVKAFVDAYNAMVTFIGEQRTAGVAGRANIGSDALVRSLQSQMRTSLMTAQTGVGDYTRLAGVGIGFDSGGKMKLDTKVFDAAMKSNPADVAKLFSGADGQSGAFGALHDIITDYTEAGGLIRDARDRLTQQSRTLAQRIDDMNVGMAIRRAALQQEYMAADLAMTRLKSQSSSLSAIGGEYRIF